MNKQEIITTISNLTAKIKKRGKAFTPEQKEEMRKEIAKLKIDLDAIELKEDIEFIEEFTRIHPLHLTQERELLKVKIEDIKNNLEDSTLKLLLKTRVEAILSELNDWRRREEYINGYNEALGYIARNEKIPSTNQNSFSKKESIQKSLAQYLKKINAAHIKLTKSFNDIHTIITFFKHENTLSGFIYLTDPIFSEASDFDKGYGIVELNDKKMYIDFTGKLHAIDSDENSIPKIAQPKTNPDLLPFEVKNDTQNNIMDSELLAGYKNSNGEIVIPAKFIRASNFINGFAQVRSKIEDIYGPTSGLIDSGGSIALNFLNHFYEFGNVYNNVVRYKKHIYQEGYVRTSSFSFDVSYQRKHLGLYCGYLVYAPIKPAILKEISNIEECKKTLTKLNKSCEIETEKLKILNHTEKIDFYLNYILQNEIL